MSLDTTSTATSGTTDNAGGGTPRHARRMGAFLFGGLLVALLLAGVVSNFAASSPDGLDAATTRGCTTDATGTITGGSCPAQRAQTHELDDSPLADYGVRGVDSDALSTGLAGVAGVLLTFALAGGLFWLTRRRTPTATRAATTATPTATTATRAATTATPAATTAGPEGTMATPAATTAAPAGTPGGTAAGDARSRPSGRE